MPVCLFVCLIVYQSEALTCHHESLFHSLEFGERGKGYATQHH